ncbi:MAG: 2Fe-2S iron-sulfur cluster binding domain-containing protein [Rhizobiales bacterium]|nr:2Fe-2S iron-sulfur cluster binding domain-containing protein [Hyphomicrobiales bacterium]
MRSASWLSIHLPPYKLYLREDYFSGADQPCWSYRTKLCWNVFEAAGIDVPYDCREGLCGSCEVRVVGSDIDHRDRVLSQNERACSSEMIICCCRAKGKKAILGL